MTSSAGHGRCAALVVAVAETIAVTSGCSGSSSQRPSDPHAAFLDAVDRVCARAVAAHQGHPFPLATFDPEHPATAQLPAVGDYFARYGGLPSTTSGLHTLTPPPADVTAWQSLLAVADQMTANAQRQITAARARDAAVFVRTLHIGQKLTNDIDSAAGRLGISDTSPCKKVYG